MSKDPAFLLYSNDFLSGVSDLTMQERGQYITLLCLQHQKGHLTEKAIHLVLGIENLDAISDLLSKFSVDKSGKFFNKRLDEEMKKRSSISKKNSANAHKKWEKWRNERSATADATAHANAEQPQMRNVCQTSASRVENENEDISISSKTLKESDYLEERNFSPVLKESIKSWFSYKQERREKYKQKGLIAFLNKAGGMARDHGDQAVIDAIEIAMANGWKGIAWEKVRGSPASPVPRTREYPDER